MCLAGFWPAGKCKARLNSHGFAQPANSDSRCFLADKAASVRWQYPQHGLACSGLAAFLQAYLGLGLGTTYIAARCQSLVTQYAQGLDLGALTCALAVFQYLEVAWTGHAVLIRHAFLFQLRAPQHQQFTDVLDGRGVELVGKRCEHGFTGTAVVGKNTHLDQPMGGQGGVDFLFDVGAQAVAADQNYRVEMVGVSTVNLALRRSQLNMWHVGIIGAMKTQSKSGKVNKAWLHDHINDPYVKLAAREGYRARAAYKLKEIDETLHLIRPGQVVVDLGCAPGAWCQYVRRRLSPQGAAVGDLNGTIIGLDMLPMEPIEGVHFIQGDFREADVLLRLEAELADRLADVVVSDMAPNLSGISSADAARMENLVELAIEFAQTHMKPQGTLVAKVFHGSSYDIVVKLFREAFGVVKPFKPKASRDRSAESFLVGQGLKRQAR